MIRPENWKDEYFVFIDEVDLQHQYFLTEINKIRGFYRHGYSYITIDDILQEIVNYAKFHFKSEENLMAEHKYPQFEIHKKEHEDLFNKLLVHSTKIEHKEESLEDLHSFLVSWFAEHTTKEDKDFGRFFNS